MALRDGFRWRRRQRREAELDAEIQSHLQMAVAERVAAGEATADAEAAVRREFGSVALVKDVTRDAWGVNALAAEWRWARRNVSARPFRIATTAILLGLAIGASTVLFSAADSLVFRRVVFADADQLVELQSRNLKTGQTLGAFFTAGTFDAWRAQADIFSDIQGYIPRTVFLTGATQPELVQTGEITPGLIALLGMAPRWGSSLTAEDVRQANPRVGLIAERLARRRFGDPALAVGQTLETTSEPIRVAGVMPEHFRFPTAQEQIWRAAEPRLDSRQGLNLYAIGRLTPGLSPEVAAAAVEQRSPTVASTTGGRAGFVTVTGPLRSARVADRQKLMMVLLVSAGLCLLLTACANVASLEVAGAVHRARVYAVHLAVGASRAALCRIALLEGMVTFAAAGLLAWFVASRGTAAVAGQLPATVANAAVNPIDFDGRALAFMLAAATASWLLSTLPVLHFISRATLLDVLKIEGHGAAGSRGGQRLRRVLTATELAVAVLLMIGGVLYVRSYLQLLSIDKGFDSSGLAVLSLTIPPQMHSSDAARRVIANTIVERLRQRPGVIAVTHGSPPPGMGAVFSSRGIETDQRPAEDHNLFIGLLEVEPDYFSVLRIPLRSGRLLERGDPATNVVVSETFARRFWPDGDAVGHRFRFDQRWFSVVGVVSHVRSSRDEVDGPSDTAFQLYQLRPPPRPAPPAGTPNPGVAFSFIDAIVRMDLPSRADDLMTTVRDIEPQVPLSIRFIDDTYAERHADVLLATRVVGGFGIFAFVVAMAGLYAVMSFMVATRIREIGVRMALGADPSAVVRFVMKSSLGVVLAGTALGLVAAAGASRWLRSQLFGVSALDFETYAVVAAVAVAAALIATWHPARRAARVDPIAALRN